MAKKKKENSFDELMKNIDFTRSLQALIPVMQPIIIFGAWVGFNKLDSRARAVSRLIAIAEPIPTVDLNVPAPVALASMYLFADEVLDILDEVRAFLGLGGKVSDLIEETKEFLETEVAKPKEGETWQSFLERRLRETGLFG